MILHSKGLHSLDANDGMPHFLFPSANVPPLPELLPKRHERPVRAPTGAASGPSRTSEATSEKILVVEDEPWIAMDMQRLLADAGYDSVALAQDADEAISIAGEMRPGLVLMDIRLAGRRDGIDAAMELMQRYGIRSIFVSAHLDGGTRRRAEAVKPYAMIDKPIDPDALIAAIRGAFGGH
jgi:CheY-like chemotaxis protein